LPSGQEITAFSLSVPVTIEGQCFPRPGGPTMVARGDRRAAE
jgi:hypothetical protein